MTNLNCSYSAYDSGACKPLELISYLTNFMLNFVIDYAVPFILILMILLPIIGLLFFIITWIKYKIKFH
jgi:hypothetical protein